MYDPSSGHMRFIEVKGRVDSADTIMITRQEVITSLHEPEKFMQSSKLQMATCGSKVCAWLTRYP